MARLGVGPSTRYGVPESVIQQFVDLAIGWRYDRAMAKTITDNQILGELGETAVKKIVLEMRFIYDPRGRLEAGMDGIIELRDPRSGAPLDQQAAHRRAHG